MATLSSQQELLIEKELYEEIMPVVGKIVPWSGQPRTLTQAINRSISNAQNYGPRDLRIIYRDKFNNDSSAVRRYLVNNFRPELVDAGILEPISVPQPDPIPDSPPEPVEEPPVDVVQPTPEPAPEPTPAESGVMPEQQNYTWILIAALIGGLIWYNS